MVIPELLTAASNQVRFLVAISHAFMQKAVGGTRYTPSVSCKADWAALGLEPTYKACWYLLFFKSGPHCVATTKTFLQGVVVHQVSVCISYAQLLLGLYLCKSVCVVCESKTSAVCHCSCESSWHLSLKGKQSWRSACRPSMILRAAMC